MFDINTALSYPLLILLSIGKKSFENLGIFINRSGDTISRLLNPASVSFCCMQEISREVFRDKKRLFFIIDDTLIKKMYSRFMQGSGWFFDTKIGRRIMAYRLIFGVLSDGKFVIPIESAYLFSKELIDEMEKKPLTKEEITQAMIMLVQRLFPKTKIIVLADGLYATKNFLTWCINNAIAAEMRMHSNRVVIYKGKKITLKKLLDEKGIRPKGRQMARTISALWHGLNLQITVVRRLDKHGDESVVFQVATYKALPREHLANYAKRWPIESVIRTCKQYLGLQDCFSRSLEVQQNHVASVLFAYALAQLEMKHYKLKTPEAAIRQLKMKNIDVLKQKFTDLYNVFEAYV